MDDTDCAIRFIRKLDWEALSPEIRCQAKRCLLDGLGALIAGYELAYGRPASATPITQPTIAPEYRSARIVAFGYEHLPQVERLA